MKMLNAPGQQKLLSVDSTPVNLLYALEEHISNQLQMFPRKGISFSLIYIQAIATSTIENKIKITPCVYKQLQLQTSTFPF